MPGTRYELVLRGHLSARVVRSVEGFEVVATEGGTTRLLGWVCDQSSLQAVVRQISDLGLELVSIAPSETD